MKSVEAILSIPLLLSAFAGAQVMLHEAGGDDSERALLSPIEPMMGLAILGLLLLSGAFLVAREMRAEANDRRARERAHR